MQTGRWSTTPLEGVLRRTVTVHADERGSFAELWRASLTEPQPGPEPDSEPGPERGPEPGRFVQANLSRSRSGVLRGMHFHRRQSDLWIVTEGRAFVALADLRGERPAILTFEMGVGDEVLIPPLVAHGFLALEELALLYLVTNEYDGTDELGFAWDDPAAAIPWPPGQPILSERDRANPTVADAYQSISDS